MQVIYGKQGDETDEKRKQLMPIANKYSLKEVIEACKYYFEKGEKF